MNVPRYSNQVARLLSSTLGEATPPPGDRAKGTATIERAIFARRKKARGLRVALLAAAAVALAAGIALAFGQISRPSVAATESPRIRATVSARGGGATLAPGNLALRDGDPLVAGSELRVHEFGTASVVLSTGTRLELEGDSAVAARNLDAHQRFYLSRGALEARVAKLLSEQRFVVETPDAEVEVRGTEFRLEVRKDPGGCDGGVRTRLSVHEGVVEVRAGGRVVRVSAGGSWPEGCRTDEPRETPLQRAPAGEKQPSPPLPPHRAPDPAALQRTRLGEPSESEPASSGALVEQNDMFAEAVAARRRGDVSGAIAAYGRLMQKYPQSALVENAMVERMRLFGRGNPEAARGEAKRYLERYPSGFARAEAERLLTGSP
jgi:ferric-dicitrate binding protein FerR (iron transport regulator)